MNAYETPELKQLLQEADEIINKNNDLLDGLGYKPGEARSYRESGRMSAEQQQQADAELRALKEELESEAGHAAENATSKGAVKVLANKLRV